MTNLTDLLNVGTGDLQSLGAGLLVLVIAIMIWKLVWYGLALYKTIQRKQIVWFTILFTAAFVLGDLGILAIIYLLIYKEKSKKKKRR